MLQLDGRRWHRVYVMQWSNAGTAYILIARKQHLLGAYDPRDAHDAQRASAIRSLEEQDAKLVVSLAKAARIPDVIWHAELRATQLDVRKRLAKLKG
jgi:hypothetical protein